MPPGDFGSRLDRILVRVRIALSQFKRYHRDTLRSIFRSEVDPLEGIGGPDRDQTDDLVVANDALYQLSYWPEPNLR